MPAQANSQTLTHAQRRAVLLYAAVTAVVLVLLMLFGLLMRFAQSGDVAVPAERFYQLMTAHGIGMVAIVGLGGAAVMWFFLSRHVALSTGVFLANLVIFLCGVVLVLASIFLGGFAGAWTFLYPLPGKSMGAWSSGAAAGYLLGVLVVGTGFLLLFLDTARAILTKYGSFAASLGWRQLFRNDGSEPPPPTVVVATVVTVMNLLSILVGAVILVVMLVELYVPGIGLNALLAKNLIFFFGHVLINSAIYMGIIAVYEILPRYTGRPWKSSRPFLAAWSAALLMVLAVYPHHLLMDFAMPKWAVVMGQILSYTSSLPVLAVTAVATLANVHRSGIRWDLASGLLFLSVFGWAAGVVPAVIDGTIAVNRVMHNTLWVPGHFHFYLLLGVVPMLLGFMGWLASPAGRTSDSLLDRAAFWAYGLGGLGFVFTFLYSGRQSVPRRFAEHLPEWMPYDRVGALFATLAVLAALVLVGRFLTRLRAAATA
jgi:cytochrome c oxidase subunit 1